VEPRRRVRQSLTGMRLASAILCLLAASPALGAQLSLSWTDNSDNEDGFRIERRLSPSGSYAGIATVAANATTYADNTVTAGQDYCYRVQAYNTAGSSGYTNEACGAAAVTLTLTVITSGTGTVTSTSPTGAIACPGDCNHSGTSVELDAHPAAPRCISGL